MVETTGSLRLDVVREGRSGPVVEPGRAVHLALVPAAGGPRRTVRVPLAGAVESVPAGGYALRAPPLRNYPYGRRLRRPGESDDRARPTVDVTVPDGGEVRVAVVLTERPLRRVLRSAFWCLILGLFLFWALREDAPLRSTSRADPGATAFGLMLLGCVIAVAFLTINHTRRHLRAYRTHPPTPVSRSPYTYVADLLVIAGFVLGSALSAVLIIAGLADAGQIDVATSDASVPYTSDLVSAVFWHMADALPAVGTPDVWGWRNPITVRGDLAWLAGVPLIAMRLLVAAGVIGFAVDCWAAVTAPRTPAATPGRS